MRLLRWILVHFPSVRGIPLQPHHLHEQTGDDNKEFVKNYDENNVHFNDAMRKNRWKSKFQNPPVPHPVVRLLRKQENGWSQTRPGPNRSKSNDLFWKFSKGCHIQFCQFLTMGLKGPLENFQTFIRFGGIVLFDDNVDRVPAWLWEVSNFQNKVGLGTWLW